LREEVFGVHSTTSGTTLQSFLAILIVNSPLLWVGKDFVGVGEIFELVRCLGVVGILILTDIRTFAKDLIGEPRTNQDDASRHRSCMLS
jgi:hypothetical protein